MSSERLRAMARVIGIGACAGVLFVGAVGCGGSDDSDTQPVSDTQEPGEDPSSGGSSAGSSSSGGSS